MPDTTRDCRQKHEFEFFSDPENLAEARAFVAEIALICSFSEQEIFDIKLAVGEALANAIEHGSPNGPSDKVTIRCYCHEDNLMIEISDQGSFKKFLPVGNNVDIDYRGRGILLMLALMDKVSIDETECGTTVHLTKKYTNKENCCENCG